jgi:hypothetical protein
MWCSTKKRERLGKRKNYYSKKKKNSGTHLALCDKETEIFENFFFLKRANSSAVWLYVFTKHNLIYAYLTLLFLY